MVSNNFARAKFCDITSRNLGDAVGVAFAASTAANFLSGGHHLCAKQRNIQPILTSCRGSVAKPLDAALGSHAA